MLNEEDKKKINMLHTTKKIVSAFILLRRFSVFALNGLKEL